LYKENPARIDPYAPEAALIFSLSPLVGTPLTTSAKFAVVAKSPLTDRLNDALSSSHFALAAKRAGMDALVITGKLTSTGMLVIDEGDVRILPADDLWGLPAADAEEQIAARLGAEYHTAIIGPAGENLVRYATISHENRHAGRGARQILRVLWAWQHGSFHFAHWRHHAFDPFHRADHAATARVGLQSDCGT
jgi:aldehyde:ferredoxin oxidoreductase